MQQQQQHATPYGPSSSDNMCLCCASVMCDLCVTTEGVFSLASIKASVQAAVAAAAAEPEQERKRRIRQLQLRWHPGGSLGAGVLTLKGRRRGLGNRMRPWGAGVSNVAEGRRVHIVAVTPRSALGRSDFGSDCGPGGFRMCVWHSGGPLGRWGFDFEVWPRSAGFRVWVWHPGGPWLALLQGVPRVQRSNCADRDLS